MYSRYLNLLLFITRASLLLVTCISLFISRTVERLVVDAALFTRRPTAAPSVSAAPSLSAAPSPLPCSISQGELNALEALYNSTNGARWLWRPPQYKNGSEWAFPAQVTDPCSSNWQGVTCQQTSFVGICYVEQLKLSLYNMHGSLPSEIGLLTGLTALDFSYNKIANSITSQVSTLTNLTLLDLSSNDFNGTIPSKINMLTKLNNLFLSWNSLTGEIPLEISVLTGLTNLYLSINSLSYSIPSELSTLTNLELLALYNNVLTSSIPSQLSTLTKLTNLYLDTNLLTSSIPSELSALTNMQNLDLYINYLSHSIPSELSTMTNLIGLDLYTNVLTNTVPSELSSLVSLQSLWLYENQLRGSIPTFIGNFQNLTEFELSVNYFTGEIPDIFCALPNLQILLLSNNILSGEFPPSFHCLNRSLGYMDVSNNNLHGNPFTFIGFPYIDYVNISSNQFDIDMSSLISTSITYITSSLEYLDISLNSLRGSLPNNIGIMFPNLKLLSASNNCFKSHIPETLCDLRNLTYILINKLGSQCTSTDVSLIINAFSRDIISSKHTIPSCLLSLPSLRTAHLIGNYLYGTLSEVSSTLLSLSLVGNVLVGSIPKSIQESPRLVDLQLSLNRFSGTLLDDAFKNLPQNLPRESTIQFYANRISGNIPSSMETFTNSNVDILGGNLFNCKNKAPSNIENYDSYSCGTASIDFYQYFYLAVGIALVIGSAVLYFLWRKRSETSQKPFWFVVYFRSVPSSFPRPLFSALANSTFLITCLLVALFMTLFNLFMKIADTSMKDSGGDLTFQASYSTHTLNYGWTTAFIYVHGILPFVMVIIGVSAVLFAYLHYMNFEYNGSNKETTNKITNSASSTSSLSLYHTMRVLLVRSTRLFSNVCYRRFIFLQLINLAAVTGVNILYIFIENETYFTLQSRYKKGVPIILSIIKIVWVNTFVIFMAKYGIRSKLPEHVVFGHYIFASLYIYVLVPVVTVFFTDVNCFYYRLNPPPSIEETYFGITPKMLCRGFDCKNFYSPLLITQSVTPPWVYSYQCGFSILTNYVPVMLSKYTIAGIVLPILKLIIVYFPPSSWIRNFRLSKMLLPYTSNAMMTGDVSLDQNDCRHFMTYRYLSNTLIDIVMLFTFGTFCPFLTFIIVMSMIVNETVNVVQVGSHIQDILQSMTSQPPSTGSSSSSSNNNNNQMQMAVFSAAHSQHKDFEKNPHDKVVREGNFTSVLASVSSRDSRSQTASSLSSDVKQDRDKVIRTKLASSIYLNSAHTLFLTMWSPMLLTTLLFCTLIFFDIIADVYMNLAGLIVTIVFWVSMILCFHSRERFDKIVACITPHCCLRDGSNNNSGGADDDFFEMN